MIAMPICDSIVCARLLVHSSGATANTMANRLHSSQRPTFQGLKLYTEAVMSFRKLIDQASRHGTGSAGPLADGPLGGAKAAVPSPPARTWTAQQAPPLAVPVALASL